MPSLRSRAARGCVLPALAAAVTHCGAPSSEVPIGQAGPEHDEAGAAADVAGGASRETGAGEDASASLDAALADADAAADVDDGFEAATESGVPAVRFVARVDRSGPAGPRFAWSGSTILARFSGASIGIRLSGASDYFDVRIDGTLQPAPLAMSPGKTDYPIASNLQSGAHELSLFRRTEANYHGSGDTTFLGLILDPAGSLLPPSAPSARRIEIVGDSTTCGYGDEGTSQSCAFSLATENYDVTYGAVAARALGADLVTIAWSGKGMYRNFGGDTAETMPVLYGRTLPDQSASTWDYASWIPDAVVINWDRTTSSRAIPGSPSSTRTRRSCSACAGTIRKRSSFAPWGPSSPARRSASRAAT